MGSSQVMKSGKWLKLFCLSRSAVVARCNCSNWVKTIHLIIWAINKKKAEAVETETRIVLHNLSISDARIHIGAVCTEWSGLLASLGSCRALFYPGWGAEWEPSVIRLCLHPRKKNTIQYINDIHENREIMTRIRLRISFIGHVCVCTQITVWT